MRRALVRATRAARRHPMVVALAVAVALVALVAWWTPSRRREGWAFTGKVKDFSGEKGVKHANFIRKKCSGGMTWTAITSNDKWKWMAQYDGDAAWKICEEAQKKAVSEDTKDKGDLAVCKKYCTIGILAAERPCMNNQESRCCKPGGGSKLTDCVDIDSAKLRDDERRVNVWRGLASQAGQRPNPFDKLRPSKPKPGGDGGNKPAPAADDLKITVYDELEKTGASKQFGVGEYPNLGEWNDRISSFHIPKGLQVALYQHVNFDGKELKYLNSWASDHAPNIKDYGDQFKDNAASSMKVLRE